MGIKTMESGLRYFDLIEYPHLQDKYNELEHYCWIRIVNGELRDWGYSDNIENNCLDEDAWIELCRIYYPYTIPGVATDFKLVLFEVLFE